jgi:hypothetical protein
MMALEAIHILSKGGGTMIAKRKPAGECYAIIFLLIFFACISLSFSGTYIIKPGSGRINGLGPTAAVGQGQAVELCFTVLDAYLYSGYQHQEYGYVVFTLETEININGSVGSGADNYPKDVRRIKGILYSLYSISLEKDQSVDDTFIATIEKFQKSIPIKSVDGRIDKSGATLKALQIAAAEGFFVKLFKKTVSTQQNQQGISDCVSFIAPSKTKEYRIRFNKLPIVLGYTIGKEIDINGQTITRLNSNEESKIRAHAIQYWRDMEDVAGIKVVPEGEKHPYANYLRVYGELPGLKRIPTGYSENPVLFTWESRPRPGGSAYYQSLADSIEYRYQLYPDQDSWSEWGKEVEAEFYFIDRGAHRFEIESRYTDDSGVLRNVPSEAYEFILEKAFVSEPKVIHKGSRGPTPGPIPDKNTIYGKSKALLIGVTKFQDLRFDPLDYAGNDVAKMKAGLMNVGFTTTDITDIAGKITRNEIITSIDKLVTDARPNDRLIIYISSHGFQDRIDKLKAYVAAYDTDQDQPNVNGIALSQIEEMSQIALRNNIKHLLIILDTCCSGLGVIKKSPAYMELSTVATEPGAHMITAGTEDQSAEMNLSDKMSTFTKYFVEGLSRGDYTKDRVITLTELLLYVRYQVGKQTNGAQTPRLSCLQGSGEMVFFLQ